MFKVLYGEVNPFSGISPTPLVARSITPTYFSKKHGDVESFTLEGVITGNCKSGNEFSGLWQKGEQLISNFSKSFQSFKIVEDVSFSGQYSYSTLYSNISLSTNDCEISFLVQTCLSLPFNIAYASNK